MSRGGKGGGGKRSRGVAVSKSRISRKTLTLEAEGSLDWERRKKAPGKAGRVGVKEGKGLPGRAACV